MGADRYGLSSSYWFNKGEEDGNILLPLSFFRVRESSSQYPIHYTKGAG